MLSCNKYSRFGTYSQTKFTFTMRLIGSGTHNLETVILARKGTEIKELVIVGDESKG